MADIDSDASDPPQRGQPDVIVNELLCFIQQKCNMLPVDDLIKITCDFFTADEVEVARCTLAKYVSGSQKRLSKQKGSQKDVSMRTLNMMLKICLDPTVKLPSFVALNLARLPPVDVNHVDINAVLIELSALRKEVRAISVLKEEIDQLKCIVHSITGAPNLPQMDRPAKSPTVGSVGIDDASRGATGINVNSSDDTSFVGLARRLRDMPTAFRNIPRKAKAKPVVGKSDKNVVLKSVKTVRNIDIFVSRLHPETTTSELIDCVQSAQNDIKIDDISCVKLTSKYEHLYSSFHVTVRVDAVHMSSAIDLLMSADFWPSGVFVKRYYKPKNG